MSRKIFALSLGALIFGIWGQAGKISADGSVVVQACGAEGCCRQGRCPHDGVCVPSTETKKIDKRVYNPDSAIKPIMLKILYVLLDSGAGLSSRLDVGGRDTISSARAAAFPFAEATA